METTQILANDGEATTGQLIKLAGDGTLKALWVSTDSYWKDIRREYDGSDLLIYEGKNMTHKAATSATT